MGNPRSGKLQRNERRARRASGAFTLLEMVVVITILAVLAASLVPVLMTPYITEKRLETVNEMKEIERAIMGRPEYGDYGYLGTIGRLPNDDNFAIELVTQGSLPAVTATPMGGPVGVPVGWNGPYLKSEYLDPTRDAWGMPYHLVFKDNDRNTGLWRIVSSGQDRVQQIKNENNDNGGNPCDDVVFPSQQTNGVTTGLWFSSKGTIYVDVWGDYGTWQKAMYTAQDGNEITGVSVWFPVDGVMQQVSCTAVQFNSIDTNTFQCNDVPFGLHTIQVGLNPSYTDPTRQFARFHDSNNAFMQNVVHQRASTYVRLMIPSSPSTDTDVPPLTGETHADATDATPKTNLSGVPADGAAYRSGLLLNPTTLSRSILGEARVWGSVSVPDDTVRCKVQLQVYKSLDNGTTFTPDAALESSVVVRGSSAGITHAPFHLSSRQGVTYGTGAQVAFRLAVSLISGSGTCSIDDFPQGMLYKQLVAAP